MASEKFCRSVGRPRLLISLAEATRRVLCASRILSSHFSSTAITDNESQSRNNSPTVQYRKLCPSPETDPTSAAKTSSALFEKLTQKKTIRGLAHLCPTP